MGSKTRRAAAVAPVLGPRYLPELRVLLPAGDADPVPEFSLKEATVFKKDGRTIANVLDMTVHGPFIVRGKLVVDTPESRSRLINRQLDHEYIEIAQSTQYAIAFSESGGCPSVWVEGASGWLEIEPARQYRPVYDKMMEGVTLYYRIQDAYKDVAEAKSKRGKKEKEICEAMAKAPIREIFFKYAYRVGDGVILPEVEKRCDDHALFLLDQFSKESAFDWSHCSIVHYMAARHSNKQQELDRAQEKANKNSVFAKARAAAAVATAAAATATAVVQVPRPTKSRSRSAEMGDEDADLVMLDAPSQRPVALRTKQDSPPPPQAPRNPVTTHPGPPGAPFASRPPEAVPVLVDLIEEVANVSGGPQGWKYTRYTTKMWNWCKIKQHKSCKEILSLYAPELLQALDSNKFRGTPLWQFLETQAASPPKSVEVKLDEILQQLLRRPAGHVVPASAGAGSPATLIISPVLSRQQSDGPRPQYSGKVPGLRPSRKRPKEPEDDGAEGSEVNSQAGPTAGVGPGHVRKLAKTWTPPPAHDPSDEDSSDSDSSIANDGSVSKVVPKSYPMQSDKPKGPRGTWICEEDGCGYVVRSALEPEQRHLVLQHMREHTSERSRLSRQAEEESQLNGLPIQNLLDKIMKEAKEKKPKPTAIQGVPVPERIKRVGLGW